LFATPAAADAIGSHGGGQGRSLRTDVYNWKHGLWPTPSANKTTSSGEITNKDGTSWDGKSKPHSKTTGKPIQTALSDVVQMRPTPKAHMEQARYSGSDRRKKKYQEANDVTNSLADSQIGRGALTRAFVESGAKGQLSPYWVERLMGYPDGWTDIDWNDVDMANFYPAMWLSGSWDAIPRVVSRAKNRTSRLKCLGNAVVPQIPELLWRLVARVL
jgi:site-specific DNA-cytosine methylase